MMPADSDQSPARFQTSMLSIFIVGLLANAAGGCSTGDFGRTREVMGNADMHRWEGVEVTSSVGARASYFQLTDGERTLRDQAYFFIEPPRSRPFWKGIFGDWDPIAPPWKQQPRFDRTAYGRKLIDEPHRSHASRYAQLIADVRNDTVQLDPFLSTVARVADLDQKRTASLKLVADLSPRERGDALARMKENALIVQWVEQCLQQRIAAYRWALEHLVIHAPDGMAADADRSIGDLSARSASSFRSTPIVEQILTVKG